MIKRERYLSKIRFFQNKPIIKVLSGIRRCGKSVLLELIQEDLKNQGVLDEHMLTLNFETVKGMKYANTDDL